MFEFVPLSESARSFEEKFRVRLGDTDSSGRLRLDGLARFLQDVATDDWENTGIGAEDTWVVRRTNIRWISERWPAYLDTVSLVTWCGGVGAAWAERRTNLIIDGEVVLEAAGLWVPTDPTGHPVRMRESFFQAYGEHVKSRKVPGRVALVSVPEDAQRRTWPLRRSDLDIVGHVNNAAIWQSLSEVTTAPLRSASVTHHGSLEISDEVTLATAATSLWLLVGGEIRVSATYEE